MLLYAVFIGLWVPLNFWMMPWHTLRVGQVPPQLARASGCPVSPRFLMRVCCLLCRRVRAWKLSGAFASFLRLLRFFSASWLLIATAGFIDTSQSKRLLGGFCMRKRLQAYLQ